MNCRSAEPLLSAFLEDDLSQKERRSLEAHILACRRCSLAARELRATLELLENVPYVETSPHFEEDLLARIRSGEALRPTVVEWLRGLLEPARLRPLFLAGAGACAAWIAVLLVNPNGVIHRVNVADVTAHSSQGSAQTPGQPAASNPSASQDSKIEVASLAAPSARRETPRASRQPNGPAGSNTSASNTSGDTVIESDWPTSTSSQDAAVPNPGSRYDDQYITDQFFLERDLGGSNNPTITPVSDRPSDDVYITF